MIPPVFAEKVSVEVPDEFGTVLDVMKGTQFVDGFWRLLRKELGNSPKATTEAVTTIVRVAQWRYWHGGQDLWVELGKALQRRPA